MSGRTALAALRASAPSVRTRITAGPALEAGLLVAGALLVAVGAGSARADPGALLLGLYAGVLLVGAAAVALAIGASADVRRVVALETVLLLLVAVPVTRVASGGELIVAMGLAIAVPTVLALWRGGPLPRRWWLALALALVVVLGGATLVAPDRYGLLRMAPFVLAFGSVFLLFGGASSAVRRRVLRFLLLLAVVQAVLAVVEPLLGSPGLWAAAKTTAAGVAKGLPNPLLAGLERSQGTLGHPLPLGVLLAVAVALLVRNAVALPVRVRLAAAVPLAAGLVLSGSRNSILLAVLVAVVLVPRWRLGRRAVIAVAGAVAVLVVAALVAAPLLGVWLGSGSATHRAGALDAVPGLLTEQTPPAVLLGNGWASTSRMFGAGLLQQDGLRAVDNELVLLLSQGGLVAVALFVALLVLALVRAERTLLPVVLVIAATALVFDVLAWPSSAALTALALASAPARARSSRTRATPAAR
ncbi:hypothetical protein [Amnibacterium endophyticum]|uniref:O-antigen ligase domain-containing protein n=1 Tax=Amnibacterium endophyticum TaxID=2109337 RepID=A0ABW4LB86_9MICO